jgi:hypothetical protein
MGDSTPTSDPPPIACQPAGSASRAPTTPVVRCRRSP